MRGIAAACQYAWQNVIKPAWDALGKAIDWLGGLFTGIKNIAVEVRDGIVATFRKGAVLLGQILQQVQIPDWGPDVGGLGLKSLGDDLVAWGQGKADGGLIGPDQLSRVADQMDGKPYARGGRNAESGGKHGNVMVGGSAAGYDDPYFDHFA